MSDIDAAAKPRRTRTVVWAVLGAGLLLVLVAKCAPRLRGGDVATRLRRACPTGRRQRKRGSFSAARRHARRDENAGRPAMTIRYRP